MNRIDGEICVVTGGTQGLGAAIARQVAQAGAAGIVICGPTAARGQAVAAGITAARTRASNPGAAVDSRFWNKRCISLTPV